METIPNRVQVSQHPVWNDLLIESDEPYAERIVMHD
jgi:hypothetical protein